MVINEILTRQNNPMDLKHPPSPLNRPRKSNHPQIRKPSTLIKTFQPLAFTKRMIGQHKLPLIRSILLPLNLLHYSQPKSLVGANRSQQNPKTLDANLDLFTQIEVWETRLFGAIFASFLATARTGDPRNDFGLEATTDHSTVAAEVEARDLDVEV
jgi:hypothetical protein